MYVASAAWVLVQRPAEASRGETKRRALDG